MKVTTIDMSKVKNKKNAFEGVQWKNATPQQMADVYAAMAKISKTRKKEGA